MIEEIGFLKFKKKKPKEIIKNIQVRIGLVGLGHVAGDQLKALQQLPSFFKIVGICDANPQKQAQIQDDVPFFTDIDDLLKSVEMDVVLVSAPVDSHFEITKIILESGRNVLLEKPATSNLDEFNVLVEISQRKNLLFVVAFHAAFAKELLWFLEFKNRHSEKLGPLTGFRCAFYDPYVKNGILLPEAYSLGGSWFDSGINALSVIGRLVNIDSLKIEEVILTRLPQYNCEIQGTVHFIFSPEDSLKTGRGSIDTNWTTGLNYKATHLYFGYSGNEVILQHSRQKVLLVNKKGEITTIADCSENRSRLVNHYMEVFRDFYSRITTRENNLDYALKLHVILFSAAKQKLI